MQKTNVKWDPSLPPFTQHQQSVNLAHWNHAISSSGSTPKIFTLPRLLSFRRTCTRQRICCKPEVLHELVLPLSSSPAYLIPASSTLQFAVFTRDLEYGWYLFLTNILIKAVHEDTLTMSASQPPKMGLDNAATIKAFLSRISPAVKPHPSSPKPDDVVEQAGKLNLSDEGNADAANTQANGAVTGATDSTAMEMIPSPEPEPSDSVPAEKVSDGIHLNAPPDHSKFKNPLVAGVQAQGSPQVSGVQAPPPTPETVSSLAIGRLFMDALEEIPQDRMLSLGDSIHAPKNYSKLRYNRSTAAAQSQNQFFSPVPQSSKPREDADFTRMSFRAAETPSPRVFSLPSPESISVTGFQLTVQGQASAATSEEDTRLGKPVQTTEEAKAPQANKPDVATATMNGSKTHTSAAPITPPLPPRLKPEHVQASRVKTPDVPDSPLDANVKGLRDLETPLQPRYTRVYPFSDDDVPHPRKEVKNAKENKPAPEVAIPKRLAGVVAGGLEIGTPGRPPTPVGGLLTPASITFGAVSPQSVKAAGITAASMPGKVDGEDLEGALYFKAWPKVEERGTRTGKPIFRNIWR